MTWRDTRWWPAPCAQSLLREACACVPKPAQPVPLAGTACLFLVQSRWERHPHLPTSHFYPAPELAIQHHFIQTERLRAFGYWEDHKRRDLVELFQSADCMKTLALCDILPNTAGGREISELALHCLEVFINQGPRANPGETRVRVLQAQSQLTRLMELNYGDSH